MTTDTPCDGAFSFSGPGVQSYWGTTWTVGTVTGVLISYTTVYAANPGPYGALGDYTVTVSNATYDPVTGDLSGTWSGNYGGGGTVTGTVK